LAKTFIGGSHSSAISTIKSRASQSTNGEDPNIKPLEKFDIIFSGEAESEDFGEEIFKDYAKWRKLSLQHDLNSLPMADRSLIDINSYKYYLDGRPTTVILTQRGCPFSCIFCGGRDVEMYNRVRSLSPSRILEEMDFLNKEFGFSSFRWFDDEVNVDPKRLVELARLLSKRDYVHRGLVRSDLLLSHPDTISALRDIGFTEVCSGVESGSNDILKRIKKGTSYEVNLEAAQMIKAAKIRYKSFVMIGHPGESSEDIEKTIKWISEAQPDGLEVFLLNPLPGSVIYDQSRPSTKYKGYDWEYEGLFFNKIDYSTEQPFHSGLGPYNIRTESLTFEELMQSRGLIEDKFKQMKKDPAGIESALPIEEIREKI